MIRKLSLLSSVLVATLMVACQPGAGVTVTPHEMITPEPQDEITDGAAGDQLPDAVGTPVDDVLVDPERVTGFEFEGITFSPDNTMTDVSAAHVEGEGVDPNGP